MQSFRFVTRLFATYARTDEIQLCLWVHGQLDVCCDKISIVVKRFINAELRFDQLATVSPLASLIQSIKCYY